MPKYVVEREIEAVSEWPGDGLRNFCVRSNGVVRGMAGAVVWLGSVVTKRKLYCLLAAANEELVREYARRCGLPTQGVAEVSAEIGPGTDE